MIFNMVGKAGGGSSGLPTFTYTGSYNLYDEGSGNWHLCLLSSGTLRFSKAPGSIDSFVVGGGGGGASCTSKYKGGAGGNGGCIYTGTGYSPESATDYAVVVGAGGEPSTAGGDSTIFGYTADGGSASSSREPASVPETAYTSKTQGGTGGYSGTAATDGADGVYPFATSGMTGCSYKYGASGGGGAGYNSSGTATANGEGGEYGGGDGSTAQNGNGTAGAANMGAGGGGNTATTGTGGTGGSGIVILRNHRSA